LASLAPGVVVAGKIVSPTSFRKLISSGEKLIPLSVPLVLQPVRKAVEPINVPQAAMLRWKGLLFYSW